MHFALCSLACRPFLVEEEVAALVVVSDSGMRFPGFAGLDVPRAMFPMIGGVSQIQEQFWKSFYIPHERDQQHRGTDRGVLVPLIMGKLEVIQLVRFTVAQIVAFRATDYGEKCGGDPACALLLWCRSSFWFFRCACTTRESDSRVGPAHVA